MTDPLTTKEPFTGHNFSHLTHPELYEEVSKGCGWFALSPIKIVAELDRLSLVINKQATVMTEFSEAVLSLTAERDAQEKRYVEFAAMYDLLAANLDKTDASMNDYRQRATGLASRLFETQDECDRLRKALNAFKRDSHYADCPDAHDLADAALKEQPFE